MNRTIEELSKQNKNQNQTINKKKLWIKIDNRIDILDFVDSF